MPKTSNKRQPAPSEQDFIDSLIIGHRGVVQNWECDLMGHLNVSFYFGRSSDQAFFMRSALGLHPAQMRAQNRGTVALEEHARFHKEVPVGGVMIGRSAPIEIGTRTMSVYQEFRNQHDDLLCSFKTLIGHFDTAKRKLVAWNDETLAQAEKWRIDLPSKAQPKFVSSNGRVPQYEREATRQAGFTRCGGAGINSWECDQFGHLNTMFYVRRLGEASPNLWHDIGIDLLGRINDGQGSVVGEICISYLNELHAGDIVETYGAITALDEKTALVEYRLFNAQTGVLSAFARLRTLHFDMKTRRASAWPKAIYDIIAQHIAS